MHNILKLTKAIVNVFSPWKGRATLKDPKSSHAIKYKLATSRTSMVAIGEIVIVLILFWNMWILIDLSK